MLRYDEGYVVPNFHSAFHIKAIDGQLLHCFVLERKHTRPKAIVEAFNRAATLSPSFEHWILVNELSRQKRDLQNPSLRLDGNYLVDDKQLTPGALNAAVIILHAPSPSRSGSQMGVPDASGWTVKSTTTEPAATPFTVTRSAVTPSAAAISVAKFATNVVYVSDLAMGRRVIQTPLSIFCMDLHTVAGLYLA